MGMTRGTRRAKYPEHDKLRKISDESQSIGAFLEWLTGDRGLVIAKYHQHDDGCGRIPRDSVNHPAECGYVDDQLEASRVGIQGLLAEYFEISLVEIEQENRRLLRQIRKGKVRV
jgi:hypothetical protein